MDRPARRKRPVRARLRKTEPRRKQAGQAVATVVALLRTEGFIGRVLALIVKMGSSLSIRKMTLNLRVGLDDPADTGCLFAVIAPVLVCLGTSTALAVSAEPEFSGKGSNSLGKAACGCCPLTSR